MATDVVQLQNDQASPGGDDLEWSLDDVQLCSGRSANGLSAVKHVVLDHEDEAAFEELLEDMIDDFAPQTALETEFATRVATLTWRLRRVPEMEVILVARLEHFQNEAPAHSQAGEDESLPWTVRWGRVATAFLQHDFAQKLGRHEAHLASQLARAIATLRDLKGG